MVETPTHATRKPGRKSPTLRVAEEWVGGRRTMPVYITEGEPFRPEMVIWLDATNDLIVANRVLEPGRHDGAEGDALLDAMKRPMAGKPRQPATIRVAEAALAADLRERLGGDIPIVVAPTPELDHLLEHMAASFGGEPDDDSYLEGGLVSPDTVAAFFHAAAALWRAAPWGLVFDSQLIELDCPALGVKGKTVSIIGNLGESFGVLILDSVAAFEAMAESGERRMAGEEVKDIGTSLFSINFERGSDLPPSMRREIEQHRWPVAEARAHPYILAIDPDRMKRPLTDADVRFATATAEALAKFFRQHDSSLVDGTFKGAREELVIEGLPERPVVTLQAPHSHAPWLIEDDIEEDLDAELAGGHKLAAAFVASERKRGRDAAWLDGAAFIGQNLYDFKVSYADGLTGEWTAALVEEYLLDFFPAKVSADEELVEKTPEIVAAFFEWLERSGGLPRRSADAIQKRIRAKRKQFARRTNDPDNFGAAKSVVMAMMDSGVDMRDENAVQRYVATLNAGLEKPASVRAISNKPGQARPRWVWDGTGTPPTPTSACPCGSGRRYKKCCMMR